MIKLLCLLTLLTAGCSSAALSTPPKPTVCNRSDRHGVYSVEYTRKSGDCGTVPTMLINFDDPKLTAGCTESGTTWSEGNCKLSTTATCADSQATAVTTQETDDGSILDGVFTFNLGGDASCTGTYNVRYTRQ